MKIGVMHWAFPPVVGGVESHLVYLYEELASRGHEISILTAPHPERDDQSLHWCSITSDDHMSIDYLLNDPAGPPRHKAVYDMMESFIMAEKPDVIHAHNFHYFVPDHAECLDELSQKYGVPTVLTVHNYWEDDLCRHLLRDIDWDKIVAVSYHMKSPCIFDAKVSPEKVEVHYHGVRLDQYCACGDSDTMKAKFGLSGRNVVFHPARACRSKGTMHSIEAVAELRKKYPDICLIVSGNGDSVDFERERPAFKSDVQQLVEDLGMEANVLFVKATSEEMPQYMNASDVILYPTIMPQGEAFGIAPVEAMACSKPVIVTNSGGLVESTYHRINGIVVNRDPDKLAAALSTNIDLLLSDRDLADYLGRNGRELAEERFDAKKMALRMEDLYNRLVNDSMVQKVSRMSTLVKPKSGLKKVGAGASTKPV